MRYNPLLLLSVFALIVSGCSKDSDYMPVSQSGYFVLTPLHGGQTIKSGVKVAMDSPDQTFNLGEVKNSKEFLFLLTNGGDQPIFDITLSSSSGAFQITPARIGYLPGKNSVSGSSGGGFIPLVTLGVTHGSRLNGVGFAGLLPMNTNQATITLTGKTLLEGDTIPISQTAEMSVTAKVMNIRAYFGSTEINLLYPEYGVSYAGPMGLADYRCYRISGNIVEIENSGNVAITVSAYQQATVISTVVINPGERKPVALSNAEAVTGLVFDGAGTICPPDRIKQYSDGNGCFCVTNSLK